MSGIETLFFDDMTAFSVSENYAVRLSCAEPEPLLIDPDELRHVMGVVHCTHALLKEEGSLVPLEKAYDAYTLFCEGREGLAAKELLDALAIEARGRTAHENLPDDVRRLATETEKLIEAVDRMGDMLDVRENRPLFRAWGRVLHGKKKVAARLECLLV